MALPENPSLMPNQVPWNGTGGAPPPAGIDLKLLAEKVYQLLLADLRLARARGARGTRGDGRP